ncbi:imidazole glycerol phosphate synthase subunit HisH [Petroclostridium sp. X23]|uniref:imidazole glycerol phosphate synthase subunit HisH n=1 Tax=Petroclostridium sp. X23 TaxID=3045146 RepID=UPI0024AE1C05|nr:imidazole glycerol phosphate synthase subunit HisH [Petroclostridium sp. X23]WHH58908.1 imidazole glycerol phosphate synthase subunit HisH [Petroclostridium sp. X23]
MIAIIDYGVGNLKSVEKAFLFLGYEAVVSDDKDFIKNADAVVLPGVGAFADAMDNLNGSRMDGLVREITGSGKPFLGICLGMQLLFDYSEEGGRPKGLGIIPGGVRLLPDYTGLKVPHMGWNKLDIVRDNELLKGLPEESYVYFVHSYYCKADNTNDVIAQTNYGISFDVAVNYKNIYATQFHPEKSGDVGMKILDNFAKMISGENQ